jgi:hypothetical protein
MTTSTPAASTYPHEIGITRTSTRITVYTSPGSGCDQPGGSGDVNLRAELRGADRVSHRGLPVFFVRFSGLIFQLLRGFVGDLLACLSF